MTFEDPTMSITIPPPKPNDRSSIELNDINAV